MSSQQALRQSFNGQGAFIPPHQALADTQALLTTAIKHYQTSSAPKLSTEQVEQLRNNACEVANQVLQIDPTSIEALNILARVALDRNDMKQAVSWANTAHAIDDKAASTWFTLGHIHLAQRALVKAERAFIRCIELDPSIFRAHTSYAYTKLQQGQTVPAFQHYRKLANIQPKDAHVRAKLFECMRQLKADYDNTELATNICHYLQWDDVNHNDLATICASLLTHRYQLNDDDAVIDIAQLAQDPLLLLSLEKLIFSDPTIEKVFTSIREHLFLSELQQPVAAHRPLIMALAHQGYNNEFVYSVSDAESQAVASLSAELSQATRNDLFRQQHKLLLLAMYQPLQRVLDQQVIASIDYNQWQPEIQPLLKKILPKKSSQQSLEQLGTITNAVSCAVKAQYEDNPYPRWLALEYHTPTTYAEALTKALPNFQAPAWIDDHPLRILIAGCGTGRHALHVARYFRNVEVLAVDISTSSLEYAQAMAERYDLHNIEYLQADILDLNLLDQKFHIIECSGVLHHMEDPAAGARQLRDLLEPEGLIKVGLYSEIARKEVVACRELIKQEGLTTGAAAIRQLRQQLFNAPDNAFEHILRSPDFFSMSGCRDLLFHVQEHRFTPTQLQQLSDSLQMSFLGFTQLPNPVRQAYNEQFPADKSMTDLTNWELFEQSNPETFAAMYQFYLQLR
jgi:2-polyprenyl-3-methyl-5-hydroxy-6-metoxy-1,4-benzoquinol methylase